MIVLLDLNYTLVANSDVKRHPFIRQIAGEQYRRWLVDLLADRTVVLITARPERYREATLESIRRKTGWAPDEAHFNDLGLPPAALKRRVVVERIFIARGGDPSGYLALESNPTTRAAYARLGIRAISVEGGPWTRLPTV